MRKILATLFFGAILVSPAYSGLRIGEGDLYVDLGGFVRTDMYCDTRENFEFRNGLLSVMPKPERLGEDNKDLNENFKFNMIDVQTRLMLTLHGPKIGNATTSGYIEADFFGSSEATQGSLSLRHAYIDINWENSGFRIGSFWHPILDATNIPSVIGMNIGAPFMPYSRVPQIRYNQKLSQNTSAYIAINTQRAFTSPGPNGNSLNYMRNTGIPEMTLGLKWSSPSFSIGANGGYKVLTPRSEFTSLTTGNTVKSDATIGSFTANAYLKFTSGVFTAKAMGMYAQNANDLYMISGYAVKTIKSDGEWEYTPFENMSTWLDLQYGTTTRCGLFCGFTKNLGTADNTQPIYFSKYNTSGVDCESVFRIAPRFGVTLGNFEINAELEYTNATYGTMDNLDKNKFNNKKSVGGIHGLIGVLLRM